MVGELTKEVGGGGGAESKGAFERTLPCKGKNIMRRIRREHE